MNLKKEPISYPVSVTEAKNHIRVTTEEEISELEHFIHTATQAAEAITGLDFAYTKNTLTLYDFVGDTIEINEGNFQEIVSITGDDVEYSVKRVYKYDYKFIIRLNNSIDVDELVIVWYGGLTDNDMATGNHDVLKNYIMVTAGDLSGPERSDYTIGSINKINAAERLLTQYKGYY